MLFIGVLEVFPARPQALYQKDDPKCFPICLRKQVLSRDNWRCQNCGASENLQVHHIQSRSKLGHDSLENLITVCAGCHGRCYGFSCQRADRIERVIVSLLRLVDYIQEGAKPVEIIAEAGTLGASREWVN